MKKIVLSLFAVLLLGAASLHGQNNKAFSVGELQGMGKLELTKVYIGYVQKINQLLPYLPFNQKGEAVSLSSMGIPNTKDNNDDIKQLDTSGGAHNDTVNTTLTNILPYADKDNLIEAILFLQKTVQYIEAGL